MISISEFYKIAEQALLLGVLVRLIYETQIKKARISSNSEFLLFVLIMSINDFGYTIFGRINSLYMFFHSFAPIAMIISGLSRYKTSILARVSISIVLGSLIYTANSLILTTIVYLVSVFYMLNEGIARINKSSNERAKILPYMAVAICLATTQIIFMLKFTGYDWNTSKFIVYYRNLLYTVFIATITLLHVRFSRLFLN